VKFDERTNTVIVTDVPSNLFQISQVIARIDARTPQVLIQSRIVETKLERDEELGIEWSASYSLSQSQISRPSTFPFQAGSTLGSFGNIFGVQSPFIPTSTTATTTGLITANPATTLGTVGIGTISGSSLTNTLNWLKKRTDTKVVSNPTLAVLNNQAAKIHIGVEFPVPNFSVDPQTGNTTVSGFDTKTIGTILNVTPHVNPSREIVVDLKPEVISVLSNATFVIGDSGEQVQLPRFGTQTVETQVRINDGETIAIGGLVKETELVEEQKIPFLGDIPIVGLLFRNTHRFGGSTDPMLKQDLLIFLTVTLLEDKPPEQTVASVAGAAP
jgi:type IV pilus assembly protein PilQ